MIGETKEKYPGDYDYVGICGFNFKDPSTPNSIELLKLTQHLWSGYWRENPIKSIVI